MARHLISCLILLVLFGYSNGQSLVSFSQGRLDEALDSCEKYYEEAVQRKDADAIFHWLTGIFDVYRQKGEYDKSFFYARKLYEISEHAENRQWLFAAIWCMAEAYSQEGDYADALTYYRRAASLSDTGTKGIDPNAAFQLERAEAFSQVFQFDSARLVYDVYKRAGDTIGAAYLVSTGECLYLNGKFQQALDNFHFALIEYQRKKYANGLMRTYPDIAKTLLATGNTRTALEYGRTGLNMALASKASHYIRDGYGLLSTAYAKLGLRDSSNEYFVKYFQVRESILNDIVKAKFATYRFEEKIATIGREKQVQAIQLQKGSLEKKILLVGCIGLVILIIAIIFVAKLNRKNEVRKRQLAETELELKALRARMDPHFIFNCLNSINRFIIKNDTINAANYLTKFAKLMRMVLESSAHSYIALEEELNILKGYLTLENLRFEHPFSWEINCPGIDTSAILVPTLVIQPFVENAIWHGLGPRQDRSGKITVNLKLDRQLLYCEILDDGVGRKRASALRREAENSGSPLGIALTIQRLERINSSVSRESGVTIQDLADENGENTGTRVLLTIPVKSE